ncbi:MAG: ABC transporter ATP-binding protein [Anaerolineae bacterium]|nr:ABC transporter ATP-binding protein [Anaerolineae bacterium]
MIHMENLTKAFKSLTAVNRVTLHVNAGEVLALLGPNGAGKTTTVRMLSSILKPTSGGASIAGYDIVKQSQLVRQHVGVLTEAPGLYTRMTGREYLEFFGRLRGMPVAHRRNRIRELTVHFKLADALDRRLGEYSKGMRQKISLVRTLLHNPPVLLLDEPTSAMDPEGARIVRDTIEQMRRDEQRAIMICTHNLSEAEELADRIAIINYGVIVKQGTLAELREEFMGPPLMELRFSERQESSKLAFMHDLVTVINQDAFLVCYTTGEPERLNPIILRKLSAAGIPVMTLSAHQQRLETVYLRILGEVAHGTTE